MPRWIPGSATSSPCERSAHVERLDPAGLVGVIARRGDAAVPEEQEHVAFGLGGQDRVLLAHEVAVEHGRWLDRSLGADAHRERREALGVVELEVVDPEIPPAGQHGLASDEHLATHALDDGTQPHVREQRLGRRPSLRHDRITRTTLPSTGRVVMDIGAGKVAVVTGAGSGIGLALSHAFAAAGCPVVLADVQVDALDAAAEAVAAHGNGTLAVPTDVSDADAVDRLARATLDRFGGVHIVCNNAGVTGAGDPWFGPIEGWTWTFGVNLFGVVHGVRSFLPHLIAGGGGHIVNTASMAGLYAGLSPVYDATKHGVVALTESLHHTMQAARVGVGVSCLCPGWVKTGIIESERNWPDQFGEVPERTAGADISREYVRRAIDEGMQPGAVADLVLDAIRADRYWIFPHPEWVEIAMERFHRIGDGIDPVQPEHFPGLPPRSQMMAEVMAAMGMHSPDD